MTSNNSYTGLLPGDILQKYSLLGPEGKKDYLVASESHIVFEMVPRDPSKPRVSSSHPNNRDNSFEVVRVQDPDIANGLLKMIFGTPIKRR